MKFGTKEIVKMTDNMRWMMVASMENGKNFYQIMKYESSGFDQPIYSVYVGEFSKADIDAEWSKVVRK
jgi:hypothetical protein